MESKTRFCNRILKKTFLVSIIASTILLIAGVVFLLEGLLNETPVKGTSDTYYYEWTPIISFIIIGASLLALIPLIWFVFKPFMDNLTLIAMNHAKKLDDEGVETFIDKLYKKK